MGKGDQRTGGQPNPGPALELKFTSRFSLQIEANAHLPIPPLNVLYIYTYKSYIICNLNFIAYAISIFYMEYNLHL